VRLVFLVIRSIIGVARFAVFLAIGLFWLASVERWEMTPVGTVAFQLNRDCMARVKALVVWRAYALRGGCFLLSEATIYNPWQFARMYKGTGIHPVGATTEKWTEIHHP
jgi:hypothetical protein